uniref:Putative kazalzinho kazal type serine protease inhibitor n=1 Tax=Panstrongylus lignarius TaxID=156445 RepID=A0A224Y014_9HEMI
MKTYLLVTLLTVFAVHVISEEMVEGQGIPCKIFKCKMIWDPICGKSGNNKTTFGNRCAMDWTNCFTKPPYVFVKNGAC